MNEQGIPIITLVAIVGINAVFEEQQQYLFVSLFNGKELGKVSFCSGLDGYIVVQEKLYRFRLIAAHGVIEGCGADAGDGFQLGGVVLGVFFQGTHIAQAGINQSPKVISCGTEHGGNVKLSCPASSQISRKIHVADGAMQRVRAQLHQGSGAFKSTRLGGLVKRRICPLIFDSKRDTPFDQHGSGIDIVGAGCQV